MKNWKRLVQNSLLVVGSFSLGIVLGEIYLRIAGISYPVLVTADKYRGWALNPGASGWYSEEGEAYVRINSDGWRDRERSHVKPENTLRIAILGDSFTEAREVPLENTFASVTERELRGCKALAGRKVEALNFGVNGYGTAQELITLRRHVWDYSPDIVLLAAFLGNDIRNNSRSLALARFAEKPYFVYRDGQLVANYSFRTVSWKARTLVINNPLLDFFKNNSRVFQVVYKNIRNSIRYIRKKQKEQQIKTGTKDKKSHQKVALGDRLVYKEPRTEVWQEAWRVTEGLIVLMRDEVVEKGADFLVVTLSNPEQVNRDISVRQKLMEKLDVDDLFYPDRRVKALGDRENFEVMNLARDFAEYAEQNNVCLHGFDNAIPCGGHWNAEGHLLAGKMIAQKLCSDHIKPLGKIEN
ncbi:MAG: SGNH/GDSL hydrolase family protein [Hormoscilla sp.]